MDSQKESALKFFNHTKLGTIYRKYFKEPIRILGKNLPKLSKVICEEYKELVEFTARYYYFKNTLFPPTRSLYYMTQANKNLMKEIPSNKVGKLRRKKFKINRDKILESSMYAFSFPHSSTYLLEFDFEQEEGSGLGPT